MPAKNQRRDVRKPAEKSGRAAVSWEFPPQEKLDATLREMAFAAMLALLLHGILWRTVPDNFAIGVIFEKANPPLREIAIDENFSPEIAPEMLPEEWRPPPPKFVNINPLAPSNEPPDTRNTGAATQRAAQPEPDKTRNDLPRLDGEEEDSTHLVNLLPREFLPPQMRPVPFQPLGQPVNTEVSPRNSIPKPPAALARGNDTAAQKRPAITPLARNDTPSPEKNGTAEKSGKSGVEVATDSEEKTPSLADTQAPKPRPQAAKIGTTGILMKNNSGTNEAGTIAVDARYSEFGDYMQRMIEVIQANWWLIIDRAKIRETYGKHVIVEFTLCRDGTIKDVEVAFSNATQAGAHACKDAIEGRAPFDPWTQEMIAMLSEEERGKFTFYYR